jgi:hypothetical protein
MDKYSVAGAKKLFSLAKTKIRLAAEAGTLECRPNPLPLVKRLSGIDVSTVEEAGTYREELLKNTCFSDDLALASAVFQCMDIVEGVKYKYEPPQYTSNVDARALAEIEKEAREKAAPVNLLLMTRSAPAGINLFIGENPPPGTLFVSGVPTSLASFLEYAFGSEYFSDNRRLKNIHSVAGHRTLILDAIHHSLGAYGAELSDEK